jgi:predicted SnoaL-like aldol condensation-catalyzing enzyme
MATNLKDTAIAFLKLASKGAAADAYAQYVGTGFRHHNPWFEGSAQALMKGMQENAVQNPNMIFEIKHAIADGEYVVVHSHVRQEPSDLGAAVVHIFRFEQDHIVELWDVGQSEIGRASCRERVYVQV